MADVEFDIDEEVTGRTEISYNLGVKTSTYISPGEVGKEKPWMRVNLRHTAKTAELKKQRQNIVAARDRYPVDSKKYAEWSRELAAIDKSIDHYVKEIKNPTREVLEEDRLKDELAALPEKSILRKQKELELEKCLEKKKRGY